MIRPSKTSPGLHILIWYLRFLHIKYIYLISSIFAVINFSFAIDDRNWFATTGWFVASLLFIKIIIEEWLFIYKLSPKELESLRYYLSRSYLKMDDAIINTIAEEAEDGNKLAIETMKFRKEFIERKLNE